jgi:hypothetical protein
MMAGEWAAGAYRIRGRRAILNALAGDWLAERRVADTWEAVPAHGEPGGPREIRRGGTGGMEEDHAT